MSTELFAEMERADLLQELGSRLSRISEAATCCGWTGSTGESLPEACYQIVECGQGGPFGTEWVSLFEARLLVAIATRLGHWVDVGAGGDWTPYMPAAMTRRAARKGAGGEGRDLHKRVRRLNGENGEDPPKKLDDDR